MYKQLLTELIQSSQPIGNGLNDLFINKNIILKRYNYHWIKSNSWVLKNIIFGENYSRECKKNISVIHGLYRKPILIDQHYWQVFDYIPPKNKSYSFQEISLLAAKLRMKNIVYSNKYEPLPLENKSQQEFDQISLILDQWDNENVSNKYDFICHRDLNPNNIIYNQQINIIDFDFSGPRLTIVDDLALALDFGYLQPPIELLEKYTLHQLKNQALPNLLQEWRCWYNQLLYLIDKCDKAKLVWQHQKNWITHQTRLQLENWFN